MDENDIELHFDTVAMPKMPKTEKTDDNYNKKEFKKNKY